MKPKILSKKDIEKAKRLRSKKGLSKRRLAIIFQVGSTTIWENVYNENYKRPKRIKTNPYKTNCKCPMCGKYITREIKGKTIPVNFQVDDQCISCYLRSIGLEYMDLL